MFQSNKELMIYTVYCICTAIGENDIGAPKMRKNHGAMKFIIFGYANIPIIHPLLRDIIY